jgi:hypothetical protein
MRHHQQPTPALSGREGRFKWAAEGAEEADLGPGEAYDAATLRARAAAAAAEKSGPAPGSSRTIAADVEGLLARYLGKKVPYTGKACVMELLTPAGSGAAKFSKCVFWRGVDGWMDGWMVWMDGLNLSRPFVMVVIHRDHRHPSLPTLRTIPPSQPTPLVPNPPFPPFRYAGVVEWANAIVLWVNVDGGDYDNFFLKNGREMTWFAGSRATGDTPVILRLLEAGRPPSSSLEKGGKDSGEGKAESVSAEAVEGKGEREGKRDEILLFCRLQGEPYVCMGRVYHTWYETRRHPVKVVWTLRDYEAIKGSADVKEVWGDAVAGVGEGEEGSENKKKG